MKLGDCNKITINGKEIDITGMSSDCDIEFNCGKQVKYNKYNLELTTIPNSDADKVLKRLANNDK